MKRRDFRELLAWAVGAVLLAVQLHGRIRLALCTTQLEMCVRTEMADVPLGENGGPREQSNASLSLSDEPSGYAGPLADVPDSALAANTGAANLASLAPSRTYGPDPQPRHICAGPSMGQALVQRHLLQTGCTHFTRMLARLAYIRPPIAHLPKAPVQIAPCTTKGSAL
jgi:hypothetical protein